MPTAALAFVIPVRDDAERLARCLQSITRTTPAGLAIEIVVADNGSIDGSARVAREAGATVLSLPDARLGEVRNRAAASTTAPIIAFVDADNEIVSGWIPAALDALAQPGIGAVGAPYHPPSPGTWVQRFYDRLRRHPSGRERTEWLGSGNIAVSRQAFVAVGGFDAGLETCEDVDLCRKLRAHRYGLLADSGMKNVHHGDPRTLRQVFSGELWRGRDNVRVSLRPPLSVRTLASAAVPIVNLLAALLLAGSLAMTAPASRIVAAGAALCLAGVIALRATAMTRHGALADWPKAIAVAGAYEAGRALAVAGRFGYRRRRRPAIA